MRLLVRRLLIKDFELDGNYKNNAIYYPTPQIYYTLANNISNSQRFDHTSPHHRNREGERRYHNGYVQ